jgi:coenzyme F420-reducing hydrogenase delta subunit
MSDYKQVNGVKVRSCKYNCGTKVAWNESKKYFEEVDHDNVHHTRERCTAFQEADKQKLNHTIDKIEKENQRTTLTVDEIVRRLRSIGINIDFDIFLKELM